MADSELKMLKSAILNEVEGYQFYTMAAQQTSDVLTRDALTFLAGEEATHKSWLLDVYQRTAQDQKPALILDFPTPGIFKSEKHRPESGSLEVSVYGIGVMMEKASIDFYRRAAQESQTEELRRICLHLAEWEAGHLEMLERIYDQMKEEWWEKQGFSPA